MTVIAGPSFGAFVNAAAAAGTLVVQPRMGFGDPDQMRAGLLATKAADATTVGTITVDSYTRVGAHAAARTALRDGATLNGYPLVVHSVDRTRAVLSGVRDATFPVQVRHGSASPLRIIRSLTSVSLDATEGGPVSYCLPYSRTSLRLAVANWRQGCELLAERSTPGRTPHLESFGGCMLGQLCPPSLLVAISVLEAMFFVRHGIRSVSLSYAQQTHPGQDAEALHALRVLAGEYLPADVDRHVVLYTYMGVYPSSAAGAARLLAASARLAARTGTERLVVKTVAEAVRIPTIAENVQAMELAAKTARDTEVDPSTEDTGVLAQARRLVTAVLDLHGDLGQALAIAFERGHLDVPFCLHPDNAGRSASTIDDDGRLRWSAVGAMPIDVDAPSGGGPRVMTTDRLVAALYHVAREFDG
ncbi:MAG TPA: methylaspartate mutase [Pseudonocardiaceae bacterium]|jgi:methylaspartate mutase epsilon subunit|nr:methylaspartate mutase [Pseudonocardiaceae bacterium]